MPLLAVPVIHTFVPPSLLKAILRLIGIVRGNAGAARNPGVALGIPFNGTASNINKYQYNINKSALFKNVFPVFYVCLLFVRHLIKLLGI